jgi:hypothetical protein
MCFHIEIEFSSNQIGRSKSISTAMQNSCTFKRKQKMRKAFIYALHGLLLRLRIINYNDDENESNVSTTLCVDNAGSEMEMLRNCRIISAVYFKAFIVVESLISSMMCDFVCSLVYLFKFESSAPKTINKVRKREK